MQPSLGASALPPAAEHEPRRSLVVRSEFDDVMSVYAKRSEHAAQIVRENPAVVDAMLTALRWMAEYCRRHGLTPDEVKVSGSMSHDGAVVLQIASRYDG